MLFLIWNLFWKIMGEIYKNNDILPPQNADTDDHELIEKRKEFLSAHKIGLWDIIKTCDFENKSSLDAKIINNSIVFLKHPQKYFLCFLTRGSILRVKSDYTVAAYTVIVADNSYFIHK